MRRWQRDTDIDADLRRSPMTTSQLAALYFPSRKKAAERLCLLHRAGCCKRIPFFQPAQQGKPEFVYYTGKTPSQRTLAHTVAVAGLRIQLLHWLREEEYDAEFWYAHELRMSVGIVPDAGLVLRKGDKSALFFFEVDLGTEIISSPGNYSLDKKLARYATYFDSKGYATDFGWGGFLRGFRVGLIVPSSRARSVQHLIGQHHHDFVLLTTSDLLTNGIGQPIWLTNDGIKVDLLGRPKKDDREGRAWIANVPR